MKICNRLLPGRRHLALAGLVLLASNALAPSLALAEQRLQAGTLACAGEGGWGQIITSSKTFRCTFSATGESVRGEYTGQIRKFGIDLGKTGDTVLMWAVFGSADAVGDNFVPGSLQGSYVGIGVDAAAGLGLGANVLVGGGDNSFVLQPVSVQVQTGLSIAAGVETFDLDYVGSLE